MLSFQSLAQDFIEAEAGWSSAQEIHADCEFSPCRECLEMEDVLFENGF